MDIVYIVSHGFAARMIMQTDLLGKLVLSGQRVGLIAPDIDDNTLKSYCSRKGIILYEFRPKLNFKLNQYRNDRKYYLEDIEQNPALYEKHIHEVKYNRSKRPWKHIRPRLLWMMYKLRGYLPFITRNFIKREETLLTNQEAIDLVTSINPSVLVSTYPVNLLEGMLLKAAKDLSKTTTIHLLSWDNITGKGKLPCLGDEYIVWGEVMRKELKAYYSVSDNKIHDAGVPHFDVHVKNRLQSEQSKYIDSIHLDQSKPFIYFGMSSPFYAPNEIDIVEWLAEMIEKNRFGEEMQFVVRPHPQNMSRGYSNATWISRLEALQSKRVGVDFPSLVNSEMLWSMEQNDMERLSDILSKSSLCINSGSTLSIDALMCDVPVVLTSFDGEQDKDYWLSIKRVSNFIHIKKLIEQGGVCKVNSYTELADKIDKYLTDPDYKITNRRNTIKKHCANYGGGATESCVNILNRIHHSTVNEP